MAQHPIGNAFPAGGSVQVLQGASPHVRSRVRIAADSDHVDPGGAVANSSDAPIRVLREGADGRMVDAGVLDEHGNLVKPTTSQSRSQQETGRSHVTTVRPEGADDELQTRTPEPGRAMDTPQQPAQQQAPGQYAPYQQPHEQPVYQQPYQQHVQPQQEQRYAPVEQQPQPFPPVRVPGMYPQQQPQPATQQSAQGRVGRKEAAPVARRERVVIESPTMGRHTVLVERVAVSGSLVCLFYANDGTATIVEPPISDAEAGLSVVINPGRPEEAHCAVMYGGWSVEIDDQLMVVLLRQSR